MAKSRIFNTKSDPRRAVRVRDMQNMHASALVTSYAADCESCHGVLPPGVLVLERDGLGIENSGFVCTTCVQGMVTAESVEFARKLPVVP